MEWIVIGVAAAVAAAGVLAIVAVMAAGAGDRLREGADVAQAALWAAGLSEREVHLLATLASVARAELDAATVEIVLAPPGWSGDGIVVSGCRIAPGRLGSRVVAGRGTVGRVLETRRTALSEARVVLAVPLGSVGVVAAASATDELFGARDVARLEALAAQTARQLDEPLRRSA